MMQANVAGRVAVTPATVLTILDEEARFSVAAATTVRLAAVTAAAPTGPTGRLKGAHRKRVRRTPFGHVGRIARTDDAWYGRIVERGRKAGRSRGRRYPAARANPFVDRATAAVESEALGLLNSGADRAAARIRGRL